MIKKKFALFISILIASSCFAQVNDKKTSTDVSVRKSNELSRVILQQDSTLFNAFNTRDSVEYKRHFTSDLEFYHDIGGVTVSLESEMKSFNEMCARPTRVRRELNKLDIEVYPIGDYGAVQVGSHYFYFTNKGEGERLGGIYKFVHVWQLKDGAWKISRVVSYGHKRN